MRHNGQNNVPLTLGDNGCGNCQLLPHLQLLPHFSPTKNRPISPRNWDSKLLTQIHGGRWTPYPSFSKRSAPGMPWPQRYSPIFIMREVVVTAFLSCGNCIPLQLVVVVTVRIGSLNQPLWMLKPVSKERGFFFMRIL